MAWSYTTGVLTSTGATEASPDSLLAGIGIVQAADATRGYRNGFVAWLAAVEVRVSTGSFIILDDDGQFELRTSSFINPGTGGVIHGNRSTLILNTSTSRIDNALDFDTGSSLIARRERPNDPSPKIVYRNTARHDYPTILATAVPAKVDIEGLDLYNAGASGTSYLKLYFGLATTANVANVRAFNGNGVIFGQYFSSTYDDSYIETLGIPSDLTSNVIVFNRPTFYTASPSSFSDAIRLAQVTMVNPTFLNNCWNGTVGFNSAGAAGRLSLVYSYTNEFKQGLTALEGVNVRFTRARQSANGSPTWTAPGNIYTASSDANGTFTAINLIDTYREGTSLTNIERFNWTAKARRYDRRTAGETIFESRVLYRHSVNMSAGYSEEVRMLSVANLTLTEVEAAALTGIALTPSGATGGTITISENHSASDIWHYYRQWIAQTANFDSNDTWTFDGTTLNMGAWSVSIGAGVTFTGNIVTTGTVTLANGATVSGTIIDATADSALTFSGIDSWIVYPTTADRDANTNALGNGTGSENYRFNFSSGTSYYLRLTVSGETTFKTVTPSAAGETSVSLQTAALLTGISSSLGFIPRAVYLDTGAASGGNGSAAAPFNDTATAVAFAKANNITQIRVGSNVVLASDSSGITFSGLVDNLVLNFGGQEIGTSRFENLLVTGTCVCTQPAQINTCAVTGVIGFDGVVWNSIMLGNFTLGGGTTFQNVFTASTVISTITVGAGNTLGMKSVQGEFIIAGVGVGSAVRIDGSSGAFTLASSCTAGTIEIRDSTVVVDNSAGSTVSQTGVYPAVQTAQTDLTAIKANTNLIPAAL